MCRGGGGEVKYWKSSFEYTIHVERKKCAMRDPLRGMVGLKRGRRRCDTEVYRTV